MAFKDLQREVLEEFASVNSESERRLSAEQTRARYLRAQAERRRLEQRERARFLIKVEHPIVVSCAVCRESLVSNSQLAGHFTQNHPDLARAYQLRSAEARDQAMATERLLRELAKAERQLAAARELVEACEQRVAQLSERARSRR